MAQSEVHKYIENYRDDLASKDGISLKQAFDKWREYCENANLGFKMPMHRFREELKNYFEQFEERATVNGVMVRSYFSGFKEN